MPDQKPSAEETRLAEDAARTKNWKRWGPYLSERQWSTVREDYSPDGSCWTYFPHDHARSRAYRWGEDGLLGICDRECRVCFALALWNDHDPILKERLFGLTALEGNHGEDVKEEYFYLDSTPTHSYMKALYKYPQREFPYRWLVEENRRRTRKDPEFELVDTGVFNDSRYFDVFVEYAKRTPNDMLIRITVVNRGPDPATLHLLPTLWAKNSWSWGCKHEGCDLKPLIFQQPPDTGAGDGRHGAGMHSCARVEHATLGNLRFDAQGIAELEGKAPRLIFTDNETNLLTVFGCANVVSHTKDAFHRWLIHGEEAAINPAQIGSKMAVYYKMQLQPEQEIVIRCRLSAQEESPQHPFDADFDACFKQRIAEADAFYADHISPALCPDDRRIARQGYGGLLWSKQIYCYAVKEWLEGDPYQPPPPPSRKHGRNSDWTHIYNRDVISMPDKWEYPWYAAWDLAFHMITFAKIDPHFAKEQLILFLREWYMHPNGQLPAYEFEFSDVNPPVHAFACWRVYKMTGPRGHRDRAFLARCFQKLLINFTWWINRKDVSGKNIFGGGFLGLDNIGVFDRSQPLPIGGILEQADGTAWMAFYCTQMLAIALELADEDPVYEDVASKFFEHYIAIADAMNSLGGTGLWDEQDGFYYDVVRLNGVTIPMRVRSMVGLIPLFAATVLDEEVIDKLKGFRKRMNWFLKYRDDLAKHITYMSKSPQAEPAVGHSDNPRYDPGALDRFLLAIPTKERLQRVLAYLLDENEFFSPHGVRSLSRYHLQHPFVLKIDGKEYEVKYLPAESDSLLFGGNSNWRGPIWVPVNFLLAEALERYALFYGDSFKVECPTGSGNWMDLQQVADEIFTRLLKLFQRTRDGRRPIYGDDLRFANDPHWKDLIYFHEYFDGDTGLGFGATHQTGWTALIARIMAGRGKKVEHERQTAEAKSTASPTPPRSPSAAPAH
ncbi:MAG TPA: hypothetical protein VMD30_02255 [Tepidisphaeraceae bacterium]|nr:hypothetical protein [Tepidisphaeraceae bacterium]